MQGESLKRHMAFQARLLVMSPGVTGKSERAGHNSVALPTAGGRVTEYALP